MDIEGQLMVTFRVAFAEFALDSPVAWTNVVLHNITDDQTHILNLGQLGCGPVVQELGTLGNDMWKGAAKPTISLRVKGPVVQPKTIYCTAETEPLIVIQRATILIIGLPFLDRIYDFPLLGHVPDLDYLFKEGVGYRGGTKEVGTLAGILRDDLDDIIQRAQLRLRNINENL